MIPRTTGALASALTILLAFLPACSSGGSGNTGTGSTQSTGSGSPSGSGSASNGSGGSSSNGSGGASSNGSGGSSSNGSGGSSSSSGGLSPCGTSGYDGSCTFAGLYTCYDYYNAGGPSNVETTECMPGGGTFSMTPCDQADNEGYCLQQGGGACVAGWTYPPGNGPSLCTGTWHANTNMPDAGSTQNWNCTTAGPNSCACYTQAMPGTTPMCPAGTDTSCCMHTDQGFGMAFCTCGPPPSGLTCAQMVAANGADAKQVPSCPQ